MKPIVLCTLALAAGFLFAQPVARATTTYALTNGGQILTFDHTAPQTILNTVTPTPAVIGTYVLLGIDIRPTVQTTAPLNPGVGSLWAIGRDGTNFQLFVIDPTNGATTAIGTPIGAGIDSTPGVNTWGFDFNPTVDRIRLVNTSAPAGNFGNNFRLNPNTGPAGVPPALASDDPKLAFVAGDPNFGTAPQIDAGAYTTGTFGGTTSLFYLDVNRDILVRAVNANEGTLQTVGSLGLPLFAEPNGFDIREGLALFSTQGLTGAQLYTVNLTTGAASLAGSFPAGTNLRGLAISFIDPAPPVPPTPPINAAPALRVFGQDRRTVQVTPAIVRGRASDESGVVALSYRVANRTGSFAGAPFAEPFAIKVRRLAFGDNRVIIRATDPTGNVTEKLLTIVRRR